MTKRTKIYLCNKKRIKKGLLIISTNINAYEMDGMRNAFKAFMDNPNQQVGILQLPPDAKWQYINLKK